MISLRQLLDQAAEHGYDVPAFNVNNLEQIQAIMEAVGVRKINIETNIRLAMTGAMRQAFAKDPSEFDPRKALIAARKAARGICKARFEAFGCAGHVARVKAVAMVAVVTRYH